MKVTRKLLLMGVIATSCCAIANAQIIYSNNFALGGAVNISNTPPTVANSVFGGTNTATWTDALGTNDTGSLLANGSDASTMQDSWILPFTPQSGHIYTLSASLTFNGNPGNWIGLGFAQRVPTNAAVGYGRFSDGGTTPPKLGPNGYDWMILTESSGNLQTFLGPHGTGQQISQNGFFTAGAAPETLSLKLVLDTSRTLWSAAWYVNGSEVGPADYTVNPTIGAVGITQNGPGNPSAVQWNNLTLAASLQPFIVQQPTSQSVLAGTAYTNMVSVDADPNGGTVSYQWFTNGVPLADSSSISGANTNILIINPVSVSDASADYYVVASDNYGAVTSSVAGLIVYTNPASAGTQIIYSNNFALGGGINISNTPPTVANNFGGGSSTAIWNDVLGINDSGSLLANGIDKSTLGNSWLLPFTPQSGHIYLLQGNVTFTNNPGNWIGLGFSENNNTDVPIGYGRFSDYGYGGPNGYDWVIVAEGSGNVQYFSGPHGTGQLISKDGFFTPGPGTHGMDVLLNTESSPWSIACYVDGVQVATSYTYASNPTISGVGMTQNGLSAPSAVHWNFLSLATTLQPFITRQPTSQTVSAGTAVTNAVVVTADPKGGPISYQWYANDVPLANSVTISGANSNILIINPVSAADGLTNYYVVVTNNYGSATSSLASLTVYTIPVITAQFPLASTNPLTLFGGTSGYVGSTPTFTVLSVIGAQPFAYQWLTNGVAVGGATNASFTFPNCQMNGPTNFACVVANSYGEATDAWSVIYIPTPEAPYPQSVLAAQPMAFWRLNEQGGVICNDYEGGHDGIYTNVVLGQPGYNSAEPSESSVAFGSGGVNNSYAGQIPGVDFAVPNGSNAVFAVEAWVEGIGGGSGAPIITKGTYGVNDAFALNLDTNLANNYEFSVRTANGTVYTADSTLAPDGNWHQLVGVCNEVNSNVSLYIDGKLAASSYIPPKSGEYEVAAPVSIGAGPQSSGTGYTLQFFGYLDDVAAYNYALSSATVARQYLTLGSSSPAFVQTPPASVTVNAGGTLVIPATLIGSPAMSYNWTDVSTGNTLATGTTNGEQLNATLTVADISGNLDGNQLELTVNNNSGSTNAYVTLNVVSGAPQIVTDVQSPFGAALGGTAANSVVASGTEPFSYQWQYNGANLTDNGRITGSQTNTLSIADAQLSDEGSYQVIVNNNYGSVTSTVATLVIENDLPIGFNSNGLGWTPNQTGAYTTPAITNGVVTLTDGAHDEARSFFFNDPQYIRAFKASFIYQAAAPSGYTGPLADGATFCLQNDPFGASALGGIGGSIGVGANGPTPAVTPSVELEFDIFPNNNVGGAGYCFQTNGVYGPYTPPGNVNLTNGPVDVSIYYANGRMALTLSNELGGATFSTNLAVGDLAQVLGTNTAYVGFTGGSGGDPSIQTISNFSFVSIPMAAIQVSGPNALVSWPGTIVGYKVQTNSDLTTTNWGNVPVLPGVTNNLNEVVVPKAGNKLFYRLHLP